MVRITLDLAPETLLWARESIGMSIEDAAKKAQVKVMDLRFWEAGAEGYGPTVPQLRRLAKTYKRPLAALLYDTPPTQQDKLPDMRVLNGGTPEPWSSELHGAFRRALFQRDVALEVFGEQVAETSQLPLLTFAQPVEQAATTIGHWLDLDRNTLNSDNSVTSMNLRELSLRIEQRGVLVLQVQRVSITEMRGFAIADRPFPVIAINGSDASNAKKFTLLHELVHVLLGEAALCTMGDSRTVHSASDIAIERFCNRVSASVLMPMELVLSHPIVQQANSHIPWDDSQLRQVSEHFGVSDEAMLVRLVHLGRASESFYWDWRDKRRDHFDSSGTGDDSKDQGSSNGGPTYYTMKVRDYGRNFVRRIIWSYRMGQIDESEVSSYLNVKFDKLDRLQAEAES